MDGLAQSEAIEIVLPEMLSMTFAIMVHVSSKPSGRFTLKYIAYLTCLLILFASHGNSESSKLLNVGDNILAFQVASNEQVTASIQISVKTACLEDFGWQWGSEDKKPVKFIQRLKIKINATDIYIPWSTYRDLGNPRHALIQSHGKQIILVLIGGDAATSYTAKILIDNGILYKRIVHHGEFPDETKEETVYSFASDDNR